MFRKIEAKLKEWKSESDKKALLVTGARQIGKSYIVRKLGKNNYKSFIEWKLFKGIVFCGGQLENTEKVLYLPWYMVMFLKQKELKAITVDFDVNP